MVIVKYLKQVAIIMGVAFAGELLNDLIPLPVPASVYGLLLMFLCLNLKIIRLEQVEESGNFLLKAMPLVFIGPGVGLMTIIPLVADSLFGFVAVSVISTLAVMIVTGLVAQFMLNAKAKKEEKAHE